jgi:hypothetical protein
VWAKNLSHPWERRLYEVDTDEILETRDGLALVTLDFTCCNEPTNAARSRLSACAPDLELGP